MSCWDMSTGCLRTPYTGQVAWWLNPNHESRFVIFLSSLPHSRLRNLVMLPMVGWDRCVMEGYLGSMLGRYRHYT
ncbi:uncharacterized protein PpBr36_09333 [Pyricularia pennisetigena]|uniref:uncharacterized protein n=1 Tax=Pyricularia pennisetigena TaxID=1578925 RepID=UPI001150A474|nr:uncharacterized protein PpBr36_09333 [Pyricularia pennisetigena]TLS22092.1 hypothetical protein PpBr36_09333 [Pyricularia pennisetigena]